MQWDLVEELHISALDSLSKHLAGEQTAVMQGGTGLHLAYGSPRFSEDLDFLVASAGATPNGPLVPWLEKVMVLVCKDVSAHAMRRNGRPVTLKSKAANASGKNPLVYQLSQAGERKDQPSTMIKCEFYCVDPTLLAQYRSHAKPLRSTVVPTITPVLQVAEVSEILLDKIHALGARGYMKHRDVFDLWWLSEAVDVALQPRIEQQVATHLAMYGDGEFDTVLARAEERLDGVSLDAMRTELERFAPPTAMNDESLRSMLVASEHWIKRVRAALAGESAGCAASGPGM